MLSKVCSAGLEGIDSFAVEIEVDVRTGMPTEVVVGLPDTAIRESKDRVDREHLFREGSSYPVDLSEVRGQAHARRALEVAVAGGHNMLVLWTAPRL